MQFRCRAASLNGEAAADRPATPLAEAKPARNRRLVATWVENRGGSVGVIVCNNALAIKMQEALSIRLSGRRVDCYTSQWQNEDAISLLDEGVTVMNKASVKGQEFDTVFILELEQSIPCQNDVM